MTLAEGKTASDLTDLLSAVSDVRGRLVQNEVPQSSPAEHFGGMALAERGSRDMTDLVVVLADLFTLVAAYQARTIGALISTDRDPFSIIPLCRSTIEHSCAVIWVLDPDASMTYEDRCARAALWKIRSDDSLVSAAARLGPKGNDTHNEKRQDARSFRTRVKKWFPHSTDLASAPMMIAGQTMPQPSAVLAHFGERWGGSARMWKGIYDYLCAVGTHPSLAAFEFLETDDEGRTRSSMSDDFLARLIRTVVTTSVKALEHYARYCEWDETDLNDFIERANEVLPDIISDDAS